MSKECIQAKPEDIVNLLYEVYDVPNGICEQVKDMVQRLEAIDNANPSEALKKLEMLSDCAEAMKEAPSSNWIKYANSETELDYKLWRAYEDLKQYILKAQEMEKVLKIIFKKNVNIIKLEFYIMSDVENALERYNTLVARDMVKPLTQEEFDLLKRYCYE